MVKTKEGMIHVDEQIQWTITDPYVYAKASELVGAMAEVQTTHGAVRGTLKEVQPDHIVVEMGGTPFYIRTQQIVWFFPVS
ncbi:YuzF family protein [Alkalicoccobacillus gibsonii]|jgi:hypothetical protein|uniref:YuzF family protein n=1 Tax=Alkalicoccobacillus gibsonii TaxID=79881 RepID=UPI001FE9D4F1|nr:YuzF family protein [Alkalicoccobacillus gibsonii]